MTVFASKNLINNLLKIENLVLEIKKIKPHLSDDQAIALILSVLNIVEKF